MPLNFKDVRPGSPLLKFAGPDTAITGGLRVSMFHESELLNETDNKWGRWRRSVCRRCSSAIVVDRDAYALAQESALKVCVLCNECLRELS